MRRDVVRRLTEAGFVNAALEGRWLVEQVAGPSADMSVPLAPEDPHIVAIAADHAVENAGLPVFDLDDTMALADFAERLLGFG